MMDETKIKMKNKDGTAGLISLEQVIKDSRIVVSPNLVTDKNNCLGSWCDELQHARQLINKK